MKGKRFVLLLVPAAVLIVLIYLFWGGQGEERTFSSGNLILNPGFEILDSSDKPDYWKEDSRGGWSVDNEVLYRGERSIRGTVPWSWLSQEVRVQPEGYYALRVNVKSDALDFEEEDYANVFLTIECLNWRKKVLKIDWGIVNATSSWALKENLISTPAGTRKIRIKLAKRQGQGSVWFDKVELVESSPNLVLNPGFETLDSSDKPKLWGEAPQKGWSSDSEETYQGDKSVRATVAWSWLSQKIPVKARRHYILRSYLKSDITTPEKEDYANTFLSLECLDEEGKVLKEDWGIVYAPFSWELRESSISTPPGTENIRIKLAKREGEGSVWFDEVKLVEVPLSTILNPSFEVLDRSGRPRFWKEHPYGGWSSDIQGAYEGERSMRATINWSWLSQQITIKPKTYYTLKAYLRSDITIPGKEDYANTFLTVECLDEEYQVVKRVWGITNATLLWQARETVFFTPPDAWQIRIKLAKRQGQGSVWFDGLELIRHRYPPHLWGDKPFFVFYFSLYAILVFLLLRMLFKKSAAPKAKKK